MVQIVEIYNIISQKQVPLPYLIFFVILNIIFLIFKSDALKWFASTKSEREAIREKYRISLKLELEPILKDYKGKLKTINQNIKDKKFKIVEENLCPLEEKADELFSFANDLCEALLSGEAKISQNNKNVINEVLNHKYDFHDNMMKNQFDLSSIIKEKILNKKGTAIFNYKKYEPIFKFYKKNIPLWLRIINFITFRKREKCLFSNM